MESVTPDVDELFDFLGPNTSDDDLPSANVYGVSFLSFFLRCGIHIVLLEYIIKDEIYFYCY